MASHPAAFQNRRSPGNEPIEDVDWKDAAVAEETSDFARRRYRIAMARQ
jgi:hypothetical protein